VDAGTIPAHGSVMVKISSAANLLTAQKTLVGQGSFADQLQATLDAVTAGRTSDACDALTSYVNHVRAQSGKQLNTTLADRLLGNAQQIRTLIGC
jgi:hypothetical protein